MIGFATRRPAVVWAACVALLIAGAIAFSRLPLATRTTVELPRLRVGAILPGAAPDVVEMYLTSPVESAVQGVRGVNRVESISSDGVSSLMVELEPHADVQMTRLTILERIELLRGELPRGTGGPWVANFVPEGLEEAPLLSITVNGPYTSGTLQRLLNERISPRLGAVEGVAGVGIRGGTDLGIAVAYDEALLRRLGISPALVADAIAGARVVQSLGTLQSDGLVRGVVLRDEPSAITDLLALPVRGPGGRGFALGELATARGEEDARGRFFRIDGAPAVAAEITRHPGADAIKTADALRAALASIEGTLPPAVRLRVVTDESEDLARELKNLGLRGAIAFAAVLVVLAVMLRRWRAVALVMGSTTVAVAATALTLYLLEIPTNLLTLAGLGMGIGILVQNGLVVAQRQGIQPDSREGRETAARKIAPAVVGSTLTTGVVLVPFLYLQGNTRAAFVPFAAAFLIALAWSVVTALLVVPALGSGASTRRLSWPRSRQLYVRTLGLLLRWRSVTLVATALVLTVLTWGFVQKVPRSPFGGFGERRTTLSVGLSFPRGSDPETLDRSMREFEEIVVGRPEVETVRSEGYGGTRAGMQVLFTRSGGLTAAPLELQERLTERAVLIGGASVNVQGVGPVFASGGMGATLSSFRIRVLGYSYDGVGRIADDLKTRLERMPRVRDTRVTSGGFYGGERGYQVTLEPDRPAMARYGVTAAALAGAVAREVRGPVGGGLLEIDGDELPVTVKAAGARDRTLDELSNAIVPAVTAAPVRVGALSFVDAREALGAVVREDQQYIRQVSYDFRGPAKLAGRTHAAFMKTLSAPAGYSIVDVTTVGRVTDDGSQRGLWGVFTVGIVLVILTVALVFDSAWGASMVFLSLPLSLAGVAASFWGLGAAFTREAAVGVILVVGLAVNHSILLVDAALARRRAHRDLGRDDQLDAGMVLRASLDRAGMIVFVTLASLASLAPLSIGTDATSLFGAMALATAGGTVFGAVGALFVVPVMLVGRRRAPHR